MVPPSQQELLQISDAAVRDTVQAFLYHPSGFHGDTGIQHYLYHRLLTNAGTRAVWPPVFGVGQSTLLLRSEHYTALPYQATGVTSTPGRFDMVFLDASAYDGDLATCPDPGQLPTLVAFEVGRNKGVSSLRGIDTPLSAERAEPSDASKLFRELRAGHLQVAYLLEFFDGTTDQRRTVTHMAGVLKEKIDEIGHDHFRAALVLLEGGNQPSVWLYPSQWASSLGLPFPELHGSEEEQHSGHLSSTAQTEHSSSAPPPVRRIPMGGRAERGSSLVPYGVFCERCSEEGKRLQEALRSEFHGRYKLLYGQKTMTVRHRTDLLLRIGNAHGRHGEGIYDIGSEVIKHLGEPVATRMREGHIPISPRMDDAVVRALIDALDSVHPVVRADSLLGL